MIHDAADKFNVNCACSVCDTRKHLFGKQREFIWKSSYFLIFKTALFIVQKVQNLHFVIVNIFDFNKLFIFHGMRG